MIGGFIERPGRRPSMGFRIDTASLRPRFAACWIALLLAVPSATAADPLTVAVLPFSNRDDTGLCDWLSVGLADVYEHALRRHPGFVPVERKRLDAIEAELNLDCLTPHSTSTVARAGRLLRADLVLYGQFLDRVGELEVEVRLVPFATNGLAANHRFTSAREAVLEQVPGSVERLARQLGRATGGATNETAFPTRSFTAFEAYHRALELIDVEEDREALRLCLEASLADPDYLAARFQLARLQQRLDQPLLADLQFLRLAEHPSVGSLSPDRLQVVAGRMGALGKFPAHADLMAEVFRQRLPPAHRAPGFRWGLLQQALRRTGTMQQGLPRTVAVRADGTVPDEKPPTFYGYQSPAVSCSIYVAPPGKRIAAVGYVAGRTAMFPFNWHHSHSAKEKAKCAWTGVAEAADPDRFPGSAGQLTLAQPFGAMLVRYPRGGTPGPLRFELVDERDLARVRIEADNGSEVMLGGKRTYLVTPCELWLRPGDHTISLRRFARINYFPKTNAMGGKDVTYGRSEPLEIRLEAGERRQLAIPMPALDVADRNADVIRQVYRGTADDHESLWDSSRALEEGSLQLDAARRGGATLVVWSAHTGIRTRDSGIETWMCRLDGPDRTVRELAVSGSRLVHRPRLLAVDQGPWWMVYWDRDPGGDYVVRQARSVDGRRWQGEGRVPGIDAVETLAETYDLNAIRASGAGIWRPDGRVWIAQPSGLAPLPTRKLPGLQEGYTSRRLTAVGLHDGQVIGVVSHQRKADWYVPYPMLIEVWTWPLQQPRGERVGRATVAHRAAPRFEATRKPTEWSLVGNTWQILGIDDGEGIWCSDGYTGVVLPWGETAEEIPVRPLGPGWDAMMTPGVFARARNRSQRISPFHGRVVALPREDGRVERLLFWHEWEFRSAFLVRGIAGRTVPEGGAQ